MRYLIWVIDFALCMLSVATVLNSLAINRLRQQHFRTLHTLLHAIIDTLEGEE